jgi:hypothetical protein
LIAKSNAPQRTVLVGRHRAEQCPWGDKGTPFEKTFGITPIVQGIVAGENCRDMRRISGILLAMFFTVSPGYGQQVRRAWVGFAEYYYEAPWTNTHAIVDLVCGSPEQEEDIEVGYETVDETAIAGRDYTETKGTHLYHAGSPTRRIKIEIAILAKPLEEDKTFRIRVTRADFPAEVSRSSGDVPVTIVGLPKLTISHYETNLFLTWRASATNFTLEVNSTIEGEEWKPQPGKPRPLPYDPSQTLTLPLPAETQFFHLRSDPN